jgi:nucleotide-binding universal stress UspA family protein
MTSISWLHSILWATDFSPGAARAKDYALFLAQKYGGRLELLHVSQSYPTLSADAVAEPYLLEPVRNEVSRVLEELTIPMRQGGVEAVSSHRVGIPSEEIVQAAREKDAALIVVGTQGRTGLEHVLLGSTAERVVKGAPCPVLTVGPGSSANGTIGIQRILIPLDFSDTSLDALEYGIQAARSFDASVILLHVLEWAWLRLHFTIGELAEGQSARKEIESRLAEYAQVVRSQGLKADTEIHGGGGPADFVIETASRQRADLIIMGTHGRRGIQRAFIGSVAEGVLRRAPCPVLTVKSPKFSPEHKRVIAAMRQPA